MVRMPVSKEPTEWPEPVMMVPPDKVYGYPSAKETAGKQDNSNAADKSIVKQKRTDFLKNGFIKRTPIKMPRSPDIRG